MSGAGRSLLPAFAFLLVLPSLVLAANSNSAEHNGLLHVVETDKYLYELPEFVQIHYVVTNVTDDPIELGISECGCPLLTLVYDPWMTAIWQDPACVDVVCVDTLDSGESYEWSTTWDMMSYATEELIEDPGIYTVRGKLNTYYPDFWLWISVEIEIVERPTYVSEASKPRAWGTIKALYR